MEKVLKDGKLYSLIEFRDKIYEDLDLSKSDLTTLLCAILIASIGLNMNSIPTIIGAMLISPLMTPILGVGFALAILDTKLLKKSFKVLFIQVAVSLLASTLYFLLSPISYASTEIIARTSPTIWDVVIAFVGGLAGIIGARKKEANNIVPGVAIATALMPPVCTVGYSSIRLPEGRQPFGNRVADKLQFFWMRQSFFHGLSQHDDFHGIQPHESGGKAVLGVEISGSQQHVQRMGGTAGGTVAFHGIDGINDGKLRCYSLRQL